MKEKGILIRADYGHIALHLREIMEERGITRNQLAKRIDARFEVVNKWYQGELEKMDLDILARICYALDCTTEDLLEYIPGEALLSRNKKKPRGIPRGFQFILNWMIECFI